MTETTQGKTSSQTRNLPTAAQIQRLGAGALLVSLLVFAQNGGQAVARDDSDELPYSQGFLVTGDYEVGGVDLREELHPIIGGFSTAPILISNVPQDADIVAAYLFWETVTTGGEAWKTEAAGVKFRGYDIDVTSKLTVKGTSTPSEGAACFGSGSLQMHMFMSDVLRFLPVRKGEDGKSTTKFVVNSEDLTAHSLPQHTVTLPVRGGNAVPESSGASLVIVYSNPAPTALKKVVIYRGNRLNHSIDDDLVQTIQGFYGSASAKSAKITHIVASGQPNNNLKFSFTAGESIPPAEQIIGAAPFTDGPASQRWWANPTFNVTTLMQPGTNFGEYGETVSTRIYHQPTNGGYDCLASGAVIFSTAVQDIDKDGLPDALEDTLGGLKDPPPPANYPADKPAPNLLPDLKAMKAGSDLPDMFFEVNAMWADADTSYGSLEAPYATKTITSCAEGETKTICTTSGNHTLPTGSSTAIVKGVNDVLDGTWSVTWESATTFSIPVASSGATGGTLYVPIKIDTTGHHHMPTPYVLGKIGDTFAARGIRVHFDVGNIDAYRALGKIQHSDWLDDYEAKTSPALHPLEPDKYLVPSTNARGGEFIEERACDATDAACQFPDYPGTVGWPLGLQYLRDQPVGNDGEQLTVADEAAWLNSSGRRRFDPTRRDYFRYLLYAHARAKPRSQPCLVDGHPAPYDSGDPMGTECLTPNDDPDDAVPDFDELKYHVPSTTSGVANLPGRNAMITLGFWDEFVGRPFQRLGTTFHEIGHLVGLWHGGQPADWGNQALDKSTHIEPNCKPNYLSSMSYNFQVHGLFDDSDEIHVDFSGAPAQGNISELLLLNDAVLEEPLPLWPAEGGFRAYRPAWFAPAGSPLATELGVSAARRYCNGAIFAPGVAPNMARVHAELSGEAIDWNGDGTDTLSASFHDANFDGVTSSVPLAGYNDWANIRLNQIGATPVGLLPGSAEGIFAEIYEGIFAEIYEGIFAETYEGIFAEVWEGIFAETYEGIFAETYEGLFAEIYEGIFAETYEGIFAETYEGIFAEIYEGIFAEIYEGVEDLTFEEARDMGKGRPHKTKACVFGIDTRFSPFDPATEQSVECANPGATTHDILVAFQQLQVGGIAAYEIQRRTEEADGGTPDKTFATIGQIAAHLFKFTDAADLANEVTYTYRVRGLADDGGDHSGWSRPIDIKAVNEPPTANPDGIYEVATGSSITINNLVLNDSDQDSMAASIVVKAIATQPVHGSAVLNPDGTVTYTPDPSFAGPYPFIDTFAYVADNGPWSGDNDGNGVTRMSGESEPATVTVRVTNASPSCTGVVTATVTAGSSTPLTAANCSDPNGDALSVTGFGAVNPSGAGEVKLNANGSFTFTASPYNAAVTYPHTVTFTYTVSDGKGETATGNVRVTVTLPQPYGFVNVQNLPPPATKSFKTGSNIPLRWQWTKDNVAVNTAGQAAVKAFACSTTIPPGVQIGGTFTPQSPGSGNSFSFAVSTNTWSFNLKLWYSDNGVLKNLPVGTYVIQVQNSVTGQVDPGDTQTCGSGPTATTLRGALVKVTK